MECQYSQESIDSWQYVDFLMIMYIWWKIGFIFAHYEVCIRLVHIGLPALGTVDIG